MKATIRHTGKENNIHHQEGNRRWLLFLVNAVIGRWAAKLPVSRRCITTNAIVDPRLLMQNKLCLGPGLAFVTYPEAISMLPLPHLWAILFFVMLYLLGMDSCFVQIEAIMSSVTDEYPVLRKHKKLVTLASCFVMFLGSLSCITNGGMYVLQLLDWYSASISVILICIVEVISIAWIYGCENFCQDIEFMMNEKVQIWWKISWKFITPCILMFIFATTIIFNTRISYNNIEYPDWAIAMGWMSAVSSMIFIPGYAIYKIFLSGKGSIYQRLVKHLKASNEWGPALPENRAAWKEHILSNTNR